MVEEWGREGGHSFPYPFGFSLPFVQPQSEWPLSLPFPFISSYLSSPIHPFLPVFSIGDSLPHSQDGGGDMETRAYREDCNFLIHNLSLFPFFSIIYILISLHYYHSPIDKSYLSVPCRHFSRLSTSCVFGGDMMENERRE